MNQTSTLLPLSQQSVTVKKTKLPVFENCNILLSFIKSVFSVMRVGPPLFIFLYSIIANQAALAQWSSNPAVNNAICTATAEQVLPTIVSDGSGGAIITWYDYRSGGLNGDIYAQRINAAGVVEWTANGVAICTATNNQSIPTIVSDGAGGAIITWQDQRAGNVDVYAQRINTTGVVEWTSNGVAISTAANNQNAPTIVSDAAGGAIITWYDSRNGTNDIYAQRINAAGGIEWTANGVAICIAAFTQDNPIIVTDGAGGAIITWDDNRIVSNYDIYAQRINATGGVQWTANGVAVCAAANSQVNPKIAPDGAEGAIITWRDSRAGNNDIYAQRISAAGVIEWTVNGVAICATANSQVNPTIVSDGAGGAIITWESNDIYAQRINAAGVIGWTANGVAICVETTNSQVNPTIVSDGAGGAIITWVDYRSGTNADIYAQQINATGVVHWTADGIAISTATSEQYIPTIVSNDAGGAIITWRDYRSVSNDNIYAQNVNANGTIGALLLPPTIASFTPSSGPVGTSVTITGTNFNATPANNIVYFGAVKAIVTGGSTTSLTVAIPVGATYQPISVLDNVTGLTAYSSKPFISTFTNPFGMGIPANFYKPKVDFATGTNPYAVAIGDIDDDGKPDMAVVNYTSNTLSVFRNTSTSGSVSASSFSAKVDFTTGTGPLNVAIGDVDGDGKPDLVVGNYSSTISVLRNTSTPGSISASSFAVKVDFAMQTSAYWVAIGDMDGDGKPDLMATNFNSSTVSILRNTSTPGNINAFSFAAKIDFATGVSPWGVAVRDLDGDGKSDLIVANNNSNTISVLRNTSNPGSISASSFAPKVDFTVGVAPLFAIGDLDGDGKPDLVTGNSGSATISILRNTATSGSISASSFAPKVDLVSGPTPTVGIGDLDGDGKPDLVVTNNGSNTFSVFRNTSISGSINASSFSAKIDFDAGTNPGTPAIGDLNGDGIPEIAAANYNSNIISVFQIATPPPAVTSFTPASGPVGTTVTILGTNFNATPANNIVYFGAVRATVTGGSTASLTVTAPVGATYQPISVLDNARGLTAYSSKPFITTFTNPFGSGIPANFYKPKVDFATGTNPYAVGLSDVDGDSKPDLVATNAGGSNTISVLQNTSTSVNISASSFAAKVDFATGIVPSSVAISDVDGDGKPDFVVVNQSSNTISVLRNTSTSGSINAASFAAKVDFVTGSEPKIVAIGDVDGDGKPDLVVANNASNSISVLRNTSTIGSINSTSFAPKVDFNIGMYLSSIAIGDVEGDGKPDLVTTSHSSDIVSVLRNVSTSGIISTSSFAPKVDFSTGTRPVSVAIGDVDGDGKPDLVIANTTSYTVSVLPGTSAVGSISSSSFAPKVDFATGKSPTAVAIGDVDGDGKPDLAVANGLSHTISVLRNTSSTGSISASSFAPKVDFATGTFPVSVAIGDVYGDGIPEIIALNASSKTISVFQIVFPTTTALTSSANPSTLGQNITFTATVSAASGTPTGSVEFFDASTSLGSGTLSGTTATFSTSALTICSHGITAVYNGDANYAASTSSVLNQVVTETFYEDNDNDGYGSTVTIEACSAPEGYVTTGGDCDDTKNTVYPGAPELCDGLDNDCNGQIDDGITFVTYYKDNDNDGYGDASQSASFCSAVPGYVISAGDCNDNNPAINPGATEVCDGIDNNCNDQTNEGVKNTYYEDADSDGYGNSAVSTQACSSPTGYVSNSTDCDDTKATVHPGATETCNGIDDDCDGQVDEEVKTTFYADTDGDNYGDPSVTTLACSAPSGYVADNTDCDDTKATVHPGATEVCNGIDDNCDGTMDEGVKSTYYRDADGDNYGDPSITTLACSGSAPDGYVADNTDCDDTNATVHPGATEVCNGIDDNCDGTIDEGVKTTFYRDADGDNYGDPSITTLACSAPSGYVANNTDCDDTKATVYPGATEVCNGIDDDCDGTIDEGVKTIFYADTDGDGFGDPDVTTEACSAPSGYVANNTDCDDTKATVHPGATETCNGIDDDCDGTIDEGVKTTFYRDADGDNYGDPSITTLACSAPSGYVADNTDCDDTKATVHPGATEICNGIDDNCDGVIDEGVKTTFYRDADGDNYGDPDVTTQACTAPSGYVSNSTDCDDTKNTVYSGAPELCDGLDNNCNGQTDDGITFVTYYKDNDNDGYGDASQSVSSCSAVSGYTTTAGDCNDNDAAINPGATEICDGIDNNCNGQIDEGVKNTYYQDADSDGFGNPAVSIQACSIPTGYVNNSTDCDDTKSLYADADGDGYGAGPKTACGVADNTDCNNADATVHTPITYYKDNDGDGFGDADNTTSVCSSIAPAGYVSNSTDCDDAKSLYADADGDGYGAGPKTACGVADNTDCNDDDAGVHTGIIYYKDNDSDGFGDANNITSVCSGTAPSGYTSNSTDCDDTEATVYPGAPELCDGKDNNCNGTMDEGVKTTFYRDADGDSYGDPSITTLACAAPAGYVANNTDCNDGDAFVYPGAPELCDGKDNNCNGTTDELVKTIFYRDADSDSYGDPSITTLACAAPAGYVANNTDCNDGDATIHPGATEVCDNKDNNCDGLVDNNIQTITYYPDADGDGYGTAANSVQACSPPAGYVSISGDCNDNAAAINPGAIEICDGIDNDCDGQTDEGVKTTYYADTDGDGFGNASVTTQACTKPTGYVTDNTDCNDSKATVYPGATEICDEFDNDCDGLIDENVTITYYRDADADGYGNAALTTKACSQPAGYVINSADCNDNNAAVKPGAIEVCYNNVDDDCDGLIDEGCIIPGQAKIYITDVTIEEGNSGIRNASFALVINKLSAMPVSVKYQTANNTATAPQDYVQKSGTVTFPANSLFQIITISVKGDVLDETDEKFKILLSNAVNATIADAEAVCTITDDDQAPAIRIYDTLTSESNLQAVIRVGLTTASGQTVKVKYDTKDGSAKAPGDYTAISNGTLVFQPGEITKYITVVVKQDALNESTEKFEVRLKQPENATIARKDAEVRIQNSWPANNTLTKNAPATTAPTDNGRIIVSPNPANQTLNLRLLDKTFIGKVQVELVDQSGSIVKQWIKSYSAEGQLMDLPVSDIASGIYIVVINGSNGQRLKYKVVVQH